jgi:hypothetical protein
LRTHSGSRIPGGVHAGAQQYDVYAVFGMPERDGEHVYNSAAVCMPDGTVKGYRKIHLPGNEINWAERGEDPLLFNTPWGPVGVGICYDIFEYPELARYYRAMARRRANPCADTNAGRTMHQNNSIRGRRNLFTAVHRRSISSVRTRTFFFQGASYFGTGDLQSGYAQFAGKASRRRRQSSEVIRQPAIELYQQRASPTCSSGVPDRLGRR